MRDFNASLSIKYTSSETPFNHFMFHSKLWSLKTELLLLSSNVNCSVNWKKWVQAEKAHETPNTSLVIASTIRKPSDIRAPTQDYSASRLSLITGHNMTSINMPTKFPQMTSTIRNKYFFTLILEKKTYITMKICIKNGFKWKWNNQVFRNSAEERYQILQTKHEMTWGI